MILTLPASGCVLREWSPQDTPALVRHAHNPNIPRFLRDGFPYPYTEENARCFLHEICPASPGTYFAISMEDEAIGGMSIHRLEDTARITGELGYWLGEAWWGRGIMSEAVKHLTDRALHDEPGGYTRIEAGVYHPNIASARVLENAGFLLEGRLRSRVIKQGEILDTLMYGKVRRRAD